MDFLEIRLAGEEPFVRELLAERTVIGRSSSCDIVVPDVRMSGRQAEIYRQERRTLIRDLGSRNGTFLNGQRITRPHTLRGSDEIQLGNCTARFHLAFDDIKGEQPVEKLEIGGRAAGATTACVRGYSRSRLSWAVVFLALAAFISSWLLLVQVWSRELPASKWDWGALILAIAILLAVGLRLIPWLRSRLAPSKPPRGRSRAVTIDSARASRDKQAPPVVEERVSGASDLVESFFVTGASLDLGELDTAAFKQVPEEIAPSLAETGDWIRELELAQKIQKLLLPQSSPSISGYRIFGDSHPCFAVGGDFFDYLELADGSVGIMLGDVSGKGVGAALLAHYTQASIRTALKFEHDLERLLPALNGDICAHSAPGQFVTACICILEPASGDIRYVNAGHCPPLVTQLHGETRFLGESNAVLGVLPDFPYVAHHLHLDPDSAIVLYSDGIPECQNGDEVEFGYEGLARFFAPRATKPPEDIMRDLEEELERFGTTAHQADDLTLLLLQRIKSDA